jgi:hypothetical protein
MASAGQPSSIRARQRAGLSHRSASRATRRSPLAGFDRAHHLHRLSVRGPRFPGTSHRDNTHGRDRIRTERQNARTPQLKTLAHEPPPALPHEAVDRRDLAEAEASAYVVGRTIGIDSTAFSFGYVTHWADSGAQVRRGIRAAARHLHGAAPSILERLGAPEGDGQAPSSGRPSPATDELAPESGSDPARPPTPRRETSPRPVTARLGGSPPRAGSGNPAGHVGVRDTGPAASRGDGRRQESPPRLSVGTCHGRTSKGGPAKARRAGSAGRPRARAQVVEATGPEATGPGWCAGWCAGLRSPGPDGR